MADLNLHPKVIFAGLGTAVGGIAAAVIQQCGGSTKILEVVLPLVGALVLGYFKSSGDWAPKSQ